MYNMQRNETVTMKIPLRSNQSDQEVFTSAQVNMFTGLSVAMLFISVWILLANTMIMAAPLVHKRLRKKTYMFISSLAAADLSTAFLVPTAWFMGVIAVYDYSYYLSVKSNIYCAFIEVCYTFPLLCSVANLFLIAVDRYIALVYPLKYNVVLTRNRSRILIVCVWFFAASMAAVNLFWNNPEINGELRCNGKDMSPPFFHYILGPYFWLTSAVMFAMYTRIYYTIRVRRHSLPTNEQIKQGASTSERKAAIMLFITFSVFVCCWTPFIVSLHLLLDEKIELDYVYYPLSLAFLNSGMNFFIYSARCKQYQSAFKKLLSCSRYEKKHSGYTVNSSSELKMANGKNSALLNVYSTNSLSVNSTPRSSPLSNRRLT